SMRETLPELERRKRRAEQLRKQREAARQLMFTRSGNSNYTNQQMGGLFPTVQKYTPDYATFGNMLAGGIGDFVTTKKSEQAEAELSKMLGGEILNAAEGIGRHRAAKRAGADPEQTLGPGAPAEST